MKNLKSFSSTKILLGFKICKNKTNSQYTSIYTVLSQDLKKKKMSNVNCLKSASTKHLVSQSINKNTYYTQKINIQIKHFLKNYKYEKLLNNYKEFNNLPNANTYGHASDETFKKSSLDAIASDSALQNLDFRLLLNTPIETLMQNRSRILLISSQLDYISNNGGHLQNFKNYVYFLKILTKEKLQKQPLKLGTCYSKQSKNSKPFTQQTKSQQALLLKQADQLNTFHNAPASKHKTQMLRTAHTGQAVQYEKQKDSLLYWALYNKDFYNNLIYPKNLCTFSNQQKDKKINFFQPSSFTNIYPKPTYCFLQIILEKYLETPYNGLHSNFIKMSPSSSIDSSLNTEYYVAQLTDRQNKTVHVQQNFSTKNLYKFYNQAEHNIYINNSFLRKRHFINPKQSSSVNNFVTLLSHNFFKKISTKTILTYWLLPVAGFAFITCNVSLLPSNIKNIDKNYITNLVCDNGAYPGRHLTILTHRPKEFIWILPAAKPNKASMFTIIDKQFFNIKTSFNSLYNFMSSFYQDALLLKRYLIKPLDAFHPQQSQGLNKNNFVFFNTENNTTHKTIVNFGNTNSLSYKTTKIYSTINPLYSNQIVKKNLTFIQRQNLIFGNLNIQNKQCLKLLKSKLIKLNKSNNQNMLPMILRSSKIIIKSDSLILSSLHKHKNSAKLNFALKKNTVVLPLLIQNLYNKPLFNKKIEDTTSKLNKYYFLDKIENIFANNIYYTPFTSYNEGLNYVSKIFKNSSLLVLDFKSMFKTAIEFDMSQKPYYLLLSKFTNLKPNFIKIAVASNSASQHLDKTIISNTSKLCKYKQFNNQAVAYYYLNQTKNKRSLENKTILLANYFENYCQFSNFQSIKLKENPIVPTGFGQKLLKKGSFYLRLQNQSSFSNENQTFTKNKIKSKPLKLKFNLMACYLKSQNKNRQSFNTFYLKSKVLHDAIASDFPLQNHAQKQQLYSDIFLSPGFKDMLSNFGSTEQPSKLGFFAVKASWPCKKIERKVESIKNSETMTSSISRFCLFNNKAEFDDYKCINNKSIASKSKKSFFSRDIFIKLLKNRAQLSSLSVLLSQEKMFKNDPENLNLKLLQKLSIQKKRKAKKQRLETRRQKKRIRFFPRPVWLRYRMFLNFLNPRFCLSKNQYKYKRKTGLNKHNKLNPLITHFRNLYAVQKSGKNSQTKVFYRQPELKKLTSLFNFKHKDTQIIKHWFDVTTAFKLNKNFNESNHNKTNQSSLKPDFEEFYNLKSYLKTKNFNVSNLKIKANYSNFNNEKKNNSSPTNNLKTNDKNTLFRDLWIAAYNNSLTNTYIPLKWFLSTKPCYKSLNTFALLKHYKARLGFASGKTQAIFKNQAFFKSIKNAYNKQRNALRINWALNKTNINSITPNNKRYLLWGTQKLRNQSKNNKTKFFEKQFITNWEYFFLNKKLNSFYKKINNKLIHKNQKLIYITNPSFQSSALTSKHLDAIASDSALLLKRQNLDASASDVKHLDEKNLSYSTQKKRIRQQRESGNISILPQNFLKKPKTQYLVFNIKDIKFFTPVLIPYVAPNQVNRLEITSFFKISNWQNQTNIPSLKHFLTTKKNLNIFTRVEHQYLLLSSCVFLHLCTLISLVTISQVRCFSKFHLILLYKLSNLYNRLIQKLSNMIKINKIHQNSILSNKLSQATFGFAKSQTNVKKITDVLDNLTRDQKVATFYKKDYKAKQIDHFKLNNKILSFSLKLLKKEQGCDVITSHRKKLIKQNLINNVVISKLKNIKSYHKIKHHDAIASDSVLHNHDMLFESKVTNLSHSFKELQKHKILLTKLNLVAIKSLFLQPRFSFGLSPDNTNRLLQTQVSQTLTANNYQINEKIFYLKKNKVFLVKFFKTKTSFMSFNLINTFQNFVRTVSNFFEKPAEFTTTWIAFGFLIEWSSDIINIIPENIDIFVWDSFYKLIRIIPLKYFFYFNSGTMLLFLNNYGFNTTPVFNPLNKLVNNSLLLKTSNKVNQNFILLTVSHLFYRRILHLIDVLIETISQPDTDLISRQEKGTLFWDIWADFLVTAADYYNVNIAALSTIKAEQNLLIKKISNDFDNGFIFSLFQSPEFFEPMQAQNRNQLLYSNVSMLLNFNKTKLKKYVQYQQNIILDKILNSCLIGSANQVKGNQSIKILFSNHDATASNTTFLITRQNHDKWSINQYLTYQSCKNLNNNYSLDLFIDFHPPKAFAHIPTIKYNKILQQPIGNLVCQIYSGIFNKQISKNLLLVNMNNNLEQQSTDYNILLIQALAGETELKIIRDNAHRYALVNRGFAIGIKLLKDVFFAIALNTPCIFLLEDIHAIGERRPMLLSDYGSSPGSTNCLSTERDEVHEKNQVVYQLTRHSIAHYKKPFKGDYSLAIPTNLYSLDLFLKHPSQSTSNLSLIFNHNVTIKNKIKTRSQDTKKASAQIQKLNKETKNLKKKKVNEFSSYLTSPFSVLLLKEEKKLKTNKIVEEIAWTGVSASSLGLQDFQRDSGKQDETKPRTSYSVRAKVSMLAEFALANISAKLDMITDLLVIIDSVRSNKGFVVFATTNIPHVLDPALRRPGRFDETICLPNINNSAILNFTTNYEIIKSVTSSSVQPLVSNSNFNTNSLVTGNIPRKILFNFPVLNSKFNLKILENYQSWSPWMSELVNQKQFSNLTVNYKDYNTILSIKTKQTQSADRVLVPDANNLNNALISFSKKLKQKIKIQDSAKQNLMQEHQETNKIHHNIKLYKKANRNLSYSKAIAYYEVGKIMVQYYLINFVSNEPNQAALLKKKQNIKSITAVSYTDKTPLNIKSLNYLSLYGLKTKFILQLMLIFAGKVGQVLSQKNILISNNLMSLRCSTQSLTEHKQDDLLLKSHLKKSFSDKPFNIFTKKIIDSEIFENNDNLKLATSLMLFFIHKRYLYLKNLIVPQLLSFTEGTVLEESLILPPFSNLLIPAKRFENYKRIFRDSLIGDNMGQRTAQISLIQKQQYQTQVNKIKLLNKKPIKTTQNLIGNAYNNMSNDIQTPTNINWYYQNLLLKRHGQYLTNQWFNGQLSEHNTETVFLSDIDWRSSFIQQKQNNLQQIKNVYTLHKKASYYSTNLKNNTRLKSQDPTLVSNVFLKVEHNGLDVLLDFPDADQYYNPRRRRWLLNKGYWSFWFNFDKVYSEEIIKTWLLESIIQTYTYLYNNTELLDFITSKFIVLGYPNYTNFNLNQKQNFAFNYSKTDLSYIKEIILTNCFKRF
uniref:Cell division protein n=1 Tax=Pandorina colemaniae TaxID=47786 RepID=A0A6C0RW34_9CHLO|nr:cell division protein [Pandorina colemaniae]